LYLEHITHVKYGLTHQEINNLSDSIEGVSFYIKYFALKGKQARI